MDTNSNSPRILNPEPLSENRRSVLTSARFWALMDRWNVPTDRALSLIGYEGRRLCEQDRPNFQMSEEQAKVLSCLLEIDLTLTVAGLRSDRSRGRGYSPAVEGACPLDAMGHCESSRIAEVLWSLNRVANGCHTVSRASARTVGTTARVR
jgi:hypothetical protein